MEWMSEGVDVETVRSIVHSFLEEQYPHEIQPFERMWESWEEEGFHALLGSPQEKPTTGLSVLGDPSAPICPIVAAVVATLRADVVKWGLRKTIVDEQWLRLLNGSKSTKW